MPSDPIPVPDLNVTFYDDFQPIATAGTYTVTVDHHLTKDGVRIDNGEYELPHVEDEYEIRAAQFVLNPASVHAFYPPPEASGLYANTLPHITFNRATLPWERQLRGFKIPQRAPWMALLVFAAGEVIDDPDATGQAANRTVADLLHPEDPLTAGPVISDSGEPESLCRTIDVEVDVFHAIVPREEELHYTAHMRDVRTVPQRRDGGEVFAEGQYAVLAANRFPRQPGSYAVHLVSLEGYLDRLDPGSLPGSERVRLCSLWSWSFTNDPVGSLNPAELLANLVAPSLGEDGVNREELALRLPAPAGEDTTSEQRYVRERLHHGYSPVPYRTLSGEQTYAWYRGPFTPLTAPELPAPVTEGPYTTADHALIYDSQYGLFDVSYAVAWTLGRTIALADPDYTGEVTSARRELANLVATLGALSTDQARAGHDPAAPAGASALSALAAPGFAAGLLQALRGPLAASPPPAASVRSARLGVRALLADTRAHAMLSAVAQARTPSMPEWLEKLGLLRGVPFNHLVPDPQMLPGESLRAFRTDKDWIQALVRGATEVGAHTSDDRDLHGLLRAAARATGTGSGDGGQTGDGLAGAGLLINSELVRAWPVFDIIATCDDEQVLVEEMRRDHLAPDVLLVLWDRVPDRVEIREPGQGIHFGIGEGNRINLRYLSGDRIGCPVDGPGEDKQFPTVGEPDLFQTYLREGSAGREPDVLNLCGGNGLIEGLGGFLGENELTPSQLALELVNAPLQQLLVPEASVQESGASQ